MALPHDRDVPRASRINEDGALVDHDPSGGDPEFEDLEEYVSAPVPSGSTPVPTTYTALGISDFLDFKSHFDPGDLSQGMTISVRIPDDMGRMMDVLVHREDLPWQTKSDVAREGIYTLLKAAVDKLRLHDPMLLSLMAETRTRAAARFAVERHAAWLEMTTNLEIQILFWLDRGEPLECGRAIQEFWTHGSQIVHAAWREHVCGILWTHPLVKAAALSAIGSGFLFSPELRTFTKDWT